MKTAIRLVERGLVPQPLVRRGIRRLVAERLREETERHAPDRAAALRAWAAELARAEVAPVPEKANEQHYEVPPRFFELCLGARLKYSSGYYETPDATLDQAEEAMLARTCERAGLRDGQRVLELGCGWGSLTLWMAEHYPASRIVAVSNSAPQRRHIEARARERGLSNVEVRTADMNAFDPGQRFDRIVSVEMFEHMRNWPGLLRRARTWLEDDGRLFLHVFAHRRFAYPFEVRDESDWMSRYFFTGGMMPSDDLLGRVDAPFEVSRHETVPGTHYSRTARLWRENLEAARDRAMDILRDTYGTKDAGRWYQRWRLFYLACEELFGFDGGSEWVVSHHTLRPLPVPSTSSPQLELSTSP